MRFFLHDGSFVDISSARVRVVAGVDLLVRARDSQLLLFPNAVDMDGFMTERVEERLDRLGLLARDDRAPEPLPGFYDVLHEVFSELVGELLVLGMDEQFIEVQKRLKTKAHVISSRTEHVEPWNERVTVIRSDPRRFASSSRYGGAAGAGHSLAWARREEEISVHLEGIRRSVLKGGFYLARVGATDPLRSTNHEYGEVEIDVQGRITPEMNASRVAAAIGGSGWSAVSAWSPLGVRGVPLEEAAYALLRSS